MLQPFSLKNVKTMPNKSNAKNEVKKDSFQQAYGNMMETIESHGLLNEECAALLMVSGGSDSTALAYLMAAARAKGQVGPIAMLHVNHKLRGADADADAEFVSGLADMLDIPLFMCEVDVAGEAARSGQNVEAVARQERYSAANDALISMCKHELVPLPNGRIVTAHTSNDRIENFYMRSIVGTGPGGFRSMKFRNGPVVRPLLRLSRTDLRESLAARETAGLSVARDDAGKLWREDATNAHTDRFRAYVRHKIVPAALGWSESMPQALTRTMDLIADEDDMLNNMAFELIDSSVHVEDDGSFKLLPPFGRAPLPLQRRAVIHLLKGILGPSERIGAAAVADVLSAFEDGAPISGYTGNIQGNLAISSNKRGVLVEPMAAYRKRRKNVG